MQQQRAGIEAIRTRPYGPYSQWNVAGAVDAVRPSDLVTTARRVCRPRRWVNAGGPRNLVLVTEDISAAFGNMEGVPYEMSEGLIDAERRQALKYLALGMAAPLIGCSSEPASAVASGPFDLIDGLGVQILLRTYPSAYHDWDRVHECLQFIGLRHIRAGAPQRGTAGYGLTEKAAAAGYKFTFTMRHNRDFDREIADLEHFAKDHPGSIEAVEGPNEIDHQPVSFGGITDLKMQASTNPAAALAYQTALYRAVKGSSVLQGVSVIAFSDFVQDRQDADFSNTHIYPRNGKTFSSRIAGLHSRLDGAGRPIIITEVGFNSLPDAVPFAGTDEATQSALIGDLVDALPRAGVRRAFIFELIDAYPPTRKMDTHFGLFAGLLDGSRYRETSVQAHRRR